MTDDTKTQALPGGGTDKGFDPDLNRSLQDIVDTQSMVRAVETTAPTAALPAGASRTDPQADPQDGAHTDPPVTPPPAASDPADTVPAAPRPASSEPSRPAGASLPTIVFGLVGILVGGIGLLFGLRFSFLATMFVAVDPQTLTAVFVGGVGVLLIVVAIVWGVVKAVAARKDNGPADSASA